jgi:galactitol-specific phosphotransferase system IIC component
MKTDMIDTWKLLMCGHLVGFFTVARLQTLLPLAMVTYALRAVLIDHVLPPFYELTDAELVASKHTHAKRQARAR